MFFHVGLFYFSPPFLTVGGERNANHYKIDFMIFSPMVETVGNEENNWVIVNSKHNFL